MEGLASVPPRAECARPHVDRDAMPLVVLQVTGQWREHAEPRDTQGTADTLSHGPGTHTERWTTHLLGKKMLCK